ncbi:MAG: ACP S-malonyltransferase [Pseudomonadota bacterium]|nr:ACP S-malonyltransferase [Pseudomonadota bacterium]
MWAAVFPGQGSQHIGMGRFLFDNFKSTQRFFEEASDSVKINFKKLCFDGDESSLSLTENTQPALVLVSHCYSEAIKETTDLRFSYLAGHSVGEYSAALAGGTIIFADAIFAVHERGKAMQEAVPEGVGAMLAVLGPDDEQVKKLCTWAESESGFSPLEAANFNCPGQVVISGSKKAADWLRENFKPELFDPPLKRIKFIELKVSAPFHCSLMKPAEEKMTLILNGLKFQKSKIPIVQNIDAKESQEAELIRSKLIKQISGTVLWTQCITRMRELGVNHILELGAGQVLSGLIKKIDSTHFKTFNMHTIEELKTLESKAKL